MDSFDLGPIVRSRALEKKDESFDRFGFEAGKKKGGGENGPIYSFPPMHLGERTHSIIVNFLGAIQEKLPGMEETKKDYFAFLNTLSRGEKIGSVLRDKLNNYIEQNVIVGIEKLAETGKNEMTTWFNNLKFEPSNEQVKTIEESLHDIDIEMFCHEHELGNVNFLAKRILTEPDFDKKLGQWLSVCENKKAEKVKKLAVALRSYAYFDLIDIKEKAKEESDFKLADIPEKFKKIILVAGSRPDILGLTFKKSDEEAGKLVVWFYNFSHGEVFGAQPLLDMAQISQEQKTKALKLLELIRNGRIRMTFVEIKTSFSKSTEKNNSIAQEPANKYYADVAHTLWSMYEFLSSVYMLADPVNGENLNWREDILKIMTEKDENSKFIIVRRLIKQLRPFIDPELVGNKIALLRLNCPLIDNDKREASPYFGMTNNLQEIKTAPIRHDIAVLDTRRITRRVMETGRKLAHMAFEESTKEVR